MRGGRAGARALAALLWLVAARAGAEEVARVSSLRFEGVRAVPEAELVAQILTSGPGWKLWQPKPAFDEQTLREDLDRIARGYRDRGYYDATAAYELTWNAERTRVDVAIRVEEGEPVRVAGREIELPPGAWLGAEARTRLLAELPLAEGAVFGAVPYREAREELLRRLAEVGHPGASLEGGAQVDLATRSARVRWRVDPGPLVRFGPLRVEGLVGVDEELVTRAIAVEPGAVFSLAALEEAQREIYDVGLFRAVTVAPERPAEPVDPAEPADPAGPGPGPGPGAAPPAGPDSEVVWPVVVRVEERPPRSVRLAVGYGTEDEFRVSPSWRHRNFLGGARTLELTGKYSALLLGVETRFSQPHFLDPELRLDVDASLARETEPSFEADRVGAGFTLTRPLVGPWVGHVGYRFEYADVTDLDVDDPEAAESARLGSIPLGVERSTVDDLLDPHSGTRLSLSITPTASFLGSDRDFTTLEAEGRLFVPIAATVLALRLRLGAIQSYAGTQRDEVPIFKRFFSGGSNSVRGFEYQKLGPLDGNGDALGGLTRTEASAELRFPVWRFLGGVVFVDAGQVARAPFAFDPDDVFYGAGPGFRIATPVGSLGLDWAYALRRPDGADPWRFHFSVGATF